MSIEVANRVSMQRHCRVAICPASFNDRVSNTAGIARLGRVFDFKNPRSNLDLIASAQRTRFVRNQACAIYPRAVAAVQILDVPPPAGWLLTVGQRGVLSRDLRVVQAKRVRIQSANGSGVWRRQ